MHVLKMPVSFRLTAARAAFTAALLGAALLVGSSSPISAHEGHGHPARIHDGNCEDLGRVAFRLTGVGADVDLDNAPIATPEAINPKSAYQVMVSETIIDATLDDILAEDRAVMIYESDEKMEVISCGNLGGAMHGDSLIVGLAEAGVPGHLGFAIFEPQGEQTHVSVILGHAMAPMSAAGLQADHDHGADDAGHSHEDDADHDHEDHEHQEDDHDAAATPAA